MTNNNSNSLLEEIKETKKARGGGEILKVKYKETALVKFDLDEKGNVMRRIIDREYKPTGKKSRAVLFPITVINTGERKNFPLAFSWAEGLIEKSSERSSQWLKQLVMAPMPSRLITEGVLIPTNCVCSGLISFKRDAKIINKLLE